MPMEPHDPSPKPGMDPRIAAGAGIMVLTLIGFYLFHDPAPQDVTGIPSPAPAARAANGKDGLGISTDSATLPEVTSRAAPVPEDLPPTGDDGQPFSKSPHYAAALAVSGMEEDATRVEAIEALMETWVATNPRQAADWAGSLPAGIFRDDALSSLMVHWAARSAPDAAAWMNRTGVDDGEAASVLASSWAGKDPAAAATWAASLRNEESRRIATSSAAAAWAVSAPRTAAAYAESLPAGERTAAITAVLGTWAAASPAEAGAWLSRLTFPSETDHAIAVAALVTTWTSQSPAAVSKYVNNLPDGPAREAAASQFAVTAAATAPAEALMWALNLRDPDQRNQVVADACENWYEGSPDTFREGIAEALGLMEDAAMRRGVYEMLYDRDPAFHDKLLTLADPVTAVPPPLQPAPTAPSAPGAPSLLFPPPLPDP
jgi:hypothetical protein